MSIEAFLLNGFGSNRGEELQAAGGELRKNCHAGVGMRVFNHGRVFMKNAPQTRFCGKENALQTRLINKTRRRLRPDTLNCFLIGSLTC